MSLKNLLNKRVTGADIRLIGICFLCFMVPFFLALKANPESWLHKVTDSINSNDQGVVPLFVGSDGKYTNLMLDANGNLPTAATVTPQSNAATEATLLAVKSFMETGTFTSTATISGAFTETNATALFNTLFGHVDGLEGIDYATEATQATRVSETNFTTKLDVLIDDVDQLEAKLDSLLGTNFSTEATLANIYAELQAKADLGETNKVSHVDLPPGASTAAHQITLQGYVDALEGLLDSTTNRLDSLETKLDTLETSANAIQTAAEILDDWDESDRAKVNPIAGQAGVAAGAGAVGANTQRFTLASDDPAVAALQGLTNTHSITMGVTVASTVYSNIVKSSAGVFQYAHVGNTNASPIYLKLYNQSSAFNPSDQTPLATFIVPGTTNGAGNNVRLPLGGVNFSTGIGVALTGGPATNDNTAPTGVYPITVVYD